MRTIPDTTDSFVPALDWLSDGTRDRSPNAERRAESLAEGLIDANRGLLGDLGVRAAPARRSGQPGIVFGTSSRIGAIPLLSPTSGRPELGLVVEPRISWASAGEMFAGSGFRVVPELLPLSQMPQSERRVPSWVMSGVVLDRATRLLDGLQRRFTLVEADRQSPRGQVLWDRWLRTRLPAGRATEVPCRFPDLREDEEIRSALAWVVRRHRDGLMGQLLAGRVVRELLTRCDLLLARLSGTAPRLPAPSLMARWQRTPLSGRVFRDGLQAIEWTVDERGLAGLNDAEGLAWRLDMEVFFEAWVESITESAARRLGARLRTGRSGQTRVPLAWRPSSLGSQRSLLPDLVLERDDVVIVIDAKYKRHAEQIERLGWHAVDESLREQHRDDVLQALAYSTLFDAPRVVSCLAYPAPPEAWERLRAIGRTMSRAQVRSGTRRVELALLSVPLSGDPKPAAAQLEALIRESA